MAPATFTIAPGASRELTITATNTNGTPNAWRFGAVTLSPSVATIPASRLPVAVRKTGVSVDPCVIPSETVVTDPANDQAFVDGVPNSPAYDIESLSVAGINPSLDGNPGSYLQWTLKVRGLTPDSLPRNSSWRMVWTSGATTYFVDMNTFEPTGVKFEYGSLDANGIFQTQGAADKGTFTADGTIQVTVATSKVGSPAVGAVLTAINADTVVLVGGAGTGLLANVDTTSEGTYTLRACGVTSGVPNAVNDSATTPQGAAITINVLSNDTDPQNQALDVTTATDPPHGTAVVNANNSITYTPDAGHSGTDSFSYTVRDPDGNTDTANVLMTITPRCPTGTFTDDLESGSDGWTTQTEVNENPLSQTWSVLNDPTTTSPTNHSWFSDGTTLMLKDDRLVMPAQDLTGASLLTFQHRYLLEDGFDGGVLEFSKDNGGTWQDILAAGAVFVDRRLQRHHLRGLRKSDRRTVGVDGSRPRDRPDRDVAGHGQCRRAGRPRRPLPLPARDRPARAGRTDRRGLVDRRRRGDEHRPRLPAAAQPGSRPPATTPRARTRTPRSRSASSRTTQILTGTCSRLLRSPRSR